MSTEKRDPRADGPADSAKAEEGFLERWSRRKTAARHEEEAPELEAAPAEQPPVADAVAAEPELDDDALSMEELAERCGLPDPSTLTADSDFEAYMRPGVPGRLRNAALRKLWVSSPTLACVDGLVEYGEDYTGLGYVGKLQTAYEVGSGYAKRIAAWEKEQAEKELAKKELAEKELAEKERAEEERAGEPSAEAEADARAAGESGADGEAGDDRAGAQTGEAAAAETRLVEAGFDRPSPRARMRFRFAED